MPGIVIDAANQPTGAHYDEVTQANGRYALLNVSVGGPYSITATMTGFKSQTKDNLFVKLGDNLVVDFQLQLELPR